MKGGHARRGDGGPPASNRALPPHPASAGRGLPPSAVLRSCRDHLRCAHRNRWGRC